MVGNRFIVTMSLYKGPDKDSPSSPEKEDVLLDQAVSEFGGSMQAIYFSQGLVLTQDGVFGRNTGAGSSLPTPLECEYGCLRFSDDFARKLYSFYEGKSDSFQNVIND